MLCVLTLIISLRQKTKSSMVLRNSRPICAAETKLKQIQMNKKDVEIHMVLRMQMENEDPTGKQKIGVNDIIRPKTSGPLAVQTEENT